LTAIEATLLTWGQLSAYLLDVKARDAWRSTAPSLTVWIKGCAQRLGRTEASLWRCITSGRFYRARCEALRQQGVALPDLPYVPEGVSAESLELLAKISRVAPPPLLNDLELSALQGHVSRAELRRVWETYRPVLGGRNARGRNALTPKFDESDPQQRLSRAEADGLMALRRAGPKWTGHPDAVRYSVFPLVEPIPLVTGMRLGIDVVIVVQPSESSRLELHGVQFKTTTHHGRPDDMLSLPECVDAGWIFFVPSAPPNPSDVPGPLGLISAEGGQCVVLRPAVRSMSEPVGREALTRVLLSRCLPH
jgi:hypothetical protein